MGLEQKGMRLPGMVHPCPGATGKSHRQGGSTTAPSTPANRASCTGTEAAPDRQPSGAASDRHDAGRPSAANLSCRPCCCDGGARRQPGYVLHFGPPGCWRCCAMQPFLPRRQRPWQAPCRVRSGAPAWAPCCDVCLRKAGHWNHGVRQNRHCAVRGLQRAHCHVQYPRPAGSRCGAPPD